MSLPVKKIYIDSRYRTKDSASTSSFKFQLARNMYMPKNTVFYIEDVCIPHTWYTIEAGINDRLYIRYRESYEGFQISDGSDADWFQRYYIENGVLVSIPVKLQGWLDRFITLTPNIYTARTLATEIQTKLTALANGRFLCSSNDTFNNISITPTGAYIFYLPTDLDLSTSMYNTWNLNAVTNNYNASYNYDRTNPMSCNEILNNANGASRIYALPGTLENVSYYVSGFLNLNLLRNIYISSPNLGSYTTLGARGESNIIKKIPVTSSYGNMIINQYTSQHDFLDCSDQTLCTLEFNFKDIKGNIIPLHGSNVSFSIVFASHNEDGVR